MKYANVHIVFIWIFSMLKLNIGIFVYNELKSEISNEF
ncbi:serine kinase [Bacillus sp. BPN334]|nr:serine kinase [Bacillus sp. BPN334]PGA98897.1 serine kinase [Bacillus wiedmannii]